MKKITISNILHLRTLRYSDATSLAKHANNINVWKNLTDIFPFPYTIQDAIEFIGSQKGKNPTEVFAIVFEDTVIGTVAMAIDKNNDKLCGEIGYWIGEVHWNKGIVTKVIKEILLYGFKTYQSINCISAYVFTSNVASMKALEKAGLKLEKTLKDSIPKDGKKMDAHYYTILRENI